MFRNRQSSQKPPEELFEKFKKSFPDVRSTTGGLEVSNTATAAAPNIQESLINQPKFANPYHDYESLGSCLTTEKIFRYHEDLDPTPRAAGEPFRFTPSLLDPNSSAFAAFANQPPGYYTPTPGAPNGGFGGHMGEMPSPNIGIGIGTPLSLSNGISMAPPPAPDMAFAPQTIQPHQFHNYHPFAQPMHPQYMDSAFSQQSGPGSPMDIGGGDLDMQPMIPMYGNKFDTEHTSYATEKFRFHVTLNAPTAMIKHPDEIPVTYLNKGQAYSISIVDTAPSAPSNLNARYRTFIRISFHDENQRAKPAQCWQLWKEGRGMNEAHQRGGKLQAVECVENTTSSEEEQKRGKVELENASFDGFAVIWSPPANGSAETSISVRFNFLSTDFSHSKGVKGIPVRLCAKTELISSGSPRSPTEGAEICFCKVKLFRDHGAERKLANDVLHVKKTIEKLRQQLQQNESNGMKLFGKKKHDGDLLKGAKPGKAPKHKRTWSMSSASSVAGGKSAEEEANEKLLAMQEMFTSTRPVSVLYLRGSDLDDPDLHPVQLAGDVHDLNEEVWNRRRSSVATTASSFVSPSPSSTSLSALAESFSPERRDWADRGYHTIPPTMGTTNGSEVPVKVKTVNEAGMLSGWIEAIGIDSSYRPPSEKPPRASMCIYILPVLPGSPSNNQYYRAVYLAQRTQASLTASIAAKCGLDPALVLRTTLVNSQGITILIDDEVVQQMPEGQPMKVQVTEISDSESPPEWNTNGDMKPLDTRGYELKLLY